MQFQLSPQNHLADVLVTIIKSVAIVSLSAVVTIVAAKMVGGASLSVNQVSTQKMSTFDVTGESEIVAIPDEATIQMGINVNKATVAQAQDEINKTINAVTKAVKDLGVSSDDIKTTNYSIYPNYDYQSSVQKITGYSASTNIVVKIKDFEKLNNVIDAGTASGANSISGVSFQLSETKEAELKKQARQEAINKAKDNAQELSKLAGMQLGKIINIYEQPNYYTPRPTFEKAMLSSDMAMGGAEPTNIEPGSTTYSYSVTLSFETL